MLLYYSQDTQEKKPLPQRQTIKRSLTRTPPAIPDDIFEDMLKALKEKGLTMKKDNDKWNQIYFRLRRWSGMLHVENTWNPLTSKREERIVYKNDDSTLLVPKESEKPQIVKGYRQASKNDGAQKLIRRINKKWTGIGRPYIQEQINKMQDAQQTRRLFDNKPLLKPVRASRVMERNQVDLVTFIRIADTFNGVTYKHVLSVMDVFSRYVFLRPISEKTDENVAAELTKLYDEIGPPHIFQTDNGGEFQGVVKQLMTSLNAKIITSSPSHPQSQGKVCLPDI